MDPNLLKELKQKTRKHSLRNRFSSSALNSSEYLELDHVDLEKNSINAENDFDFPPPPSFLSELPEEVSEDYHHDLNNFNKRINYKLCCCGTVMLMIISLMGALYKLYIL